MKTNKTLRTAILSALLATTTGAYAMPENVGGTASNTNKVEEIDQKTDKVYLTVKRESLKDNGWAWERLTVEASKAEEMIKELLEDPDVLAVEEDSILKPQTSTNTKPDLSRYYNDEGYINQQIFKDVSNTKMRLIEALERTSSKETVRIGVLDGGFEASNDVMYQDGYNFAVWPDEPNISQGPAFKNGESGICADAEQANTHGAGVSSIAGAKVNNHIGIAGVAPNAEIVAGRVSSCSGHAFETDIAEGIVWMTGYGSSATGTQPIEPVDVINISIGGPGQCKMPLQEAINEATSKGISVVVAAGNELNNADNISPANCENVITVAGTTHDGELWEDLEWNEGSNTGSVVDIAATAHMVRMLKENDRVTLGIGTSMATPIVTGAIAAVKRERPTLKQADFEQALRFSGNPLAVESDHNNGIGGGVLDLMKLMDEAGIPRAQVPLNHAIGGERERFTSALLHPKASTYMKAHGTISDNVCDLAELDASDLNPSNPDANVQFFRVSKGAPLTPVEPSSETIKTLPQGVNQGIVQFANQLNTTAYDYGIAQCDTNTARDCNQKDTIRAIDPEALKTPAACEGQITALL